METVVRAASSNGPGPKAGSSATRSRLMDKASQGVMETSPRMVTCRPRDWLSVSAARALRRSGPMTRRASQGMAKITARQRGMNQTATRTNRRLREKGRDDGGEGMGIAVWKAWPDQQNPEPT
jgi:hypothetical protein